ncbi:MAG: four helix bundle protein [Clostridiales bacterium]|nr:four helix bundle protein [Clostridiales bacterium]
MGHNILHEKSKRFALRIVRLNRFLSKSKHEYVIGKQLLRCGTSIGANVTEAIYAQSTADFYAKLHIALKEAAETEYWLELLHESGILNDKEYVSIHADLRELLRLLTAILKHDPKGH